jgi:hypothetical protein
VQDGGYSYGGLGSLSAAAQRAAAEAITPRACDDGQTADYSAIVRPTRSASRSTISRVISSFSRCVLPYTKLRRCSSRCSGVGRADLAASRSFFRTSVNLLTNFILDQKQRARSRARTIRENRDVSLAFATRRASPAPRPPPHSHNIDYRRSLVGFLKQMRCKSRGTRNGHRQD